jgi:hypothetical protein
VVTWTLLLERLGGLLDDVPSRLALLGLASCLAVSGALLRRASQHYVAGPATGWRRTTWEKAMEAERRAARRESDHEVEREAAEHLDWER